MHDGEKANMLNKSSEKHPIGKIHIGDLGYTNHYIDDVVGKIEVLSSGKTIEHVAETSIGVVLIPVRLMAFSLRMVSHFLKLVFSSEITIWKGSRVTSTPLTLRVLPGDLGSKRASRISKGSSRGGG
ncbi:hypothetical protein Tco_0107021 [Tanacetum coccineum]